MAVLTITITDPPAFDKKSSEVQHILKILDHLEMEIGRGRGTVTSGTIIGTSPTGATNVSLGSWSYSASASKP
jgi:hypothetical protein